MSLSDENVAPPDIECGPCFEGRHDLCDGSVHVVVDDERKSYPCVCFEHEPAESSDGH